ncbi:MAG TPA: SMP-30/gluconolactonase/LRE family protein [Anaerolineales bacterium]|nr:SMP-30/gluconolactonase/LRE family protein [Anaerolineales bacterium]
MNLTESFIHSQNQLGEGPLWHPDEQALYWVDIHQNRVERYSLANEKRQTIQFQRMVTALGLRKSGGFIAATADGVGYWDGQSAQVALFAHPETHFPENRFNDGKVGPDGRFWAGTMRERVDLDTPPPGSLYRVDADETVQKMETGLHISNGLGWSPDRRFFYLTDSPRKTITRYRFDSNEGEITERKIFLHTPDEPGVPDGLAVDAEGCIWSARWGGWKVARYSPKGETLQEIHLPVEYVTSCAFGGADLKTLFITTAWTPLNADARAAQPLAGDIFSVEVDVQGQMPWRFAG